MEKGILFSKAEKSIYGYEKSFCFGEAPKSSYWDGAAQTLLSFQEVARKEAQRYDEIMDKIISVQFS